MTPPAVGVKHQLAGLCRIAPVVRARRRSSDRCCGRVGQRLADKLLVTSGQSDHLVVRRLRAMRLEDLLARALPQLPRTRPGLRQDAKAACDAMRRVTSRRRASS